MGFIAHDAIVVTSWNEEHISKAHVFATNLGLPTSNVVDSKINGYQSFFLIAPDGSKEGWVESAIGDNQRKLFVDWVRESGLYLDWVHIRFGGDLEGPATIEDDSDEDQEEE